MSFSFTEKKRIRKDFGKQKPALDVPDLLTLQVNSYEGFLQKDVDPEKRKNVGLQATFNNLFPIESFSKNARLEFVSYRLEEPEFNERECQLRGLSYAAPLRVKTKLITYDKNTDKETVKEVKDIKQTGDTTDVYFGEIPLMTEHGTFIINGTDRVIVSQLHRSPGVFFDHDKGVQTSGKLLFSARVIPYRGSWLDFEFDAKDNIFARIDRRRKIPATILLHALDFSDQDIIDIFFDKDSYRLSKKAIEVEINTDHLKGTIAEFDIKFGRKLIVSKGKRINALHIKQIKETRKKYLEIQESDLLGKVLSQEIVDKKTGEIIANANDELTTELIELFKEHEVKDIKTIYINDVDQGPYISNSLSIDPSSDKESALIEIYRMMRPGEPPTKEAAENLFTNLFFNEDIEKHTNDIYLHKKWPEKPLFYVCCPSKTDPTVAPANKENIFILIPIASGLNDNLELREKYFNYTINKLEEYCNQDIKKNVEFKRSYCIHDFEKDYNALKGNAFGLANTLMQTANLKPKIINKKVRNLYYTGQLTVPGPGVPPAIISGELVAKHILGKNKKKN